MIYPGVLMYPNFYQGFLTEYLDFLKGRCKPEKILIGLEDFIPSSEVEEIMYIAIKSDLLSKAGEYKLSLEILENVIAKYPKEPQLYASRAKIYLEASEKTFALADYVNVLRLSDHSDSSRYSVFNEVAEILVNMSSLEVKSFWKSCGIDHPSRYRLIAEYFIKKGDSSVAVENLLLFVKESFADDIYIGTAIKKIIKMSGEGAREALLRLEEMIKVNDSIKFLIISLKLNELCFFQESLSFSSRISDKDLGETKIVEKYLSRGYAYGELGNWEYALKEYNSALKENGSHIPTLISKAYVLHKLKFFKPALDILEKALFILSTMGLLFPQGDKYEDFSILSKGQSEDNEMIALIYFRAGVLCSNLSDEYKMRNYFDNAVRYDPSFEKEIRAFESKGVTTI